MTVNQPRGIVAVTCNLSDADGHVSHRAGHRYLTALQEISGAVPILVPALGDSFDVEALLDNIDGIVLTGGVSNVEPHRYGGDPCVECGPHDPGRDGVALAMIRAAVRRGMPVFGICRGIQEINVAFGGTLHPELNIVPGRFNHRRPREKPVDVQLAPRQSITLTPGGYLHKLMDGVDKVMVNTLHGQGIDRLADGISIEAVADDGTIEAVRIDAVSGFAIGVQWHPEWKADEHMLYTALFRGFGLSVHEHAARRHGLMRQAAE